MVQSMRSQRVGHALVTEHNKNDVGLLFVCLLAIHISFGEDRSSLLSFLIIEF